VAIMRMRPAEMSKAHFDKLNDIMDPLVASSSERFFEQEESGIAEGRLSLLYIDLVPQSILKRVDNAALSLARKQKNMAHINLAGGGKGKGKGRDSSGTRDDDDDDEDDDEQDEEETQEGVEIDPRAARMRSTSSAGSPRPRTTSGTYCMYCVYCTHSTYCSLENFYKFIFYPFAVLFNDFCCVLIFFFAKILVSVVFMVCVCASQEAWWTT
jgi:hypothetical protein